MPVDQIHPGSVEQIAGKRPDSRTLIRAANRTTIAAIVDSLMGNESFLALIGEAATGKTTLASMLLEELISRSVRALQIGKGESREISVRQIVAEVLGEPQAELTAADAQAFIEVMTRREAPAQRLVLIIDDAECLRPDALSCLLLLGSLPRAVAAQVVFIGRPQFWRVLGHTDGAEGNGIIRRQWELAEPPGWGNRTPDRLTSKSRDDDPSADAPASVDAEAEPEEREGTAQPAGRPRWQTGVLGFIAVAAAVMFVVSPATLRSEHGKPGRGVWGDPPFERKEGTTPATAQVALADPGFLITRDPPEAADTAAAGAKPEVIEPSPGITIAATSADRYIPGILPTVAGAALPALSANPADGAGGPLLAAAAASATQAPLVWAYDVAGLDISRLPEPPPIISTTVDTAPHPPADAAPVPETGGAEPAASAAWQAGGAAAAAASQAADDAAPIVAEASRTAQPLAATEPAAIAPTEHPIMAAAAAETALPVAETSKQPASAGEPPHSVATETNAPPADAAPIPEEFGATWQAGSAVAEAVAQAADGAAIAGPPVAAARPAADATPSGPATAPTVAEATPTAEPLAATDPAAFAPAENPILAGAAETALHVAETSKAPEPAFAREPPRSAATDTNALHASPQAALAQPGMPPAAEQPPANAGAESVSPAPPPPEAARVVAQTAAPPSAIAPAGVGTDKGQADNAVSNRAPPPPDAVPPLDLTLLLSRADSMLALGDISAARRLYERAAALGNARAATAAGKTYDAAFLASIRAQGIVPDQAAASEWYRKAAALGDREAADRLTKLTPHN